MQWLSIKKFIPPTSNDLLIRVQHKSQDYERYITASTERIYSDMDNLSHWDMANGAYYDITLEMYFVTHFMIIDAVEIEGKQSE